MTISEQFGISILCAPMAQIDRRSLSQAWYSAICRTSGGAVASPQEVGKRAAARTGSSPPGAQRHSAARSSSRPLTCGARRSDAIKPLPGERRAAPPLARKIGQAVVKALSSPKAPARATFALDAALGRVQILLQTSHDAVRIVAICTRSARGEVARAIEKARYALAARGVAASAMVVERA